MFFSRRIESMAIFIPWLNHSLIVSRVETVFRSRRSQVVSRKTQVYPINPLLFICTEFFVAPTILCYFISFCGWWFEIFHKLRKKSHCEKWNRQDPVKRPNHFTLENTIYLRKWHAANHLVTHFNLMKRNICVWSLCVVYRKCCMEPWSRGENVDFSTY